MSGSAKQTSSGVVSTGEYFVLMLLFMIPIVGLVVYIIMAFTSTNINRRNFTRATLIWCIIGVVLSVLTTVVFGSIFARLGGLGLLELFQN